MYEIMRETKRFDNLSVYFIYPANFAKGDVTVYQWWTFGNI